MSIDKHACVLVPLVFLNNLIHHQIHTELILLNCKETHLTVVTHNTTLYSQPSVSFQMSLFITRDVPITIPAVSRFFDSDYYLLI